MSLTVQRECGGAPVVLPADVSAVLLKKYPSYVSEVRAASSLAPFKVTPPVGVALLGQSAANKPLEPQAELRTSTHIWYPSARRADQVVFIGQPLHGEVAPFQLRAPTPEIKAEQQRKADFDKKQAQLKVALASNKIAYEAAKQHGEVLDVGALAIERDRIEAELSLPFDPRVVVRAVDDVIITPLSIHLPLGYFRHPETGLLWKLATAADTKDHFKQITPILFINGVRQP